MSQPYSSAHVSACRRQGHGIADMREVLSPLPQVPVGVLRGPDVGHRPGDRHHRPELRQEGRAQLRRQRKSFITPVSVPRLTSTIRLLSRTPVQLTTTPTVLLSIPGLNER